MKQRGRPNVVLRRYAWPCKSAIDTSMEAFCSVCEAWQNFLQQIRWVSKVVSGYSVTYTLRVRQVITHYIPIHVSSVSSQVFTSKVSFFSFSKLRIFSKFFSWADNFLGSVRASNSSSMSLSDVLVLFWLS